MLLFTSITLAADDAPKSKVAIFPLAGDAPVDLRERVGFSLRSKLDREATYEAVSGIEMTEAVEGIDSPVSFATPVDAVDDLSKPLAADVVIWGELSKKDAGHALAVKVFDFRALDTLPFEIRQQIDQPTDVRFVSERVLEHLADVKRFEHPTEEAVTDDAASAALWAANPNLVVNGGFDEAGHWERIFKAERHPVRLGSALPDYDKIVIYTMTEADGTPNKVLAMQLSRATAEGPGLAALSEPIAIQPDTRYRLQFRYRSGGPKLHIFVKGYTNVPDGKGGTIEREIYRRQVPPTGGTDRQWVTIIDDLNPQHVNRPVQHLRVSLYTYLHPGLVMFDDVMLKAVGGQTRKAVDAAIDLPATRPVR
ncbi:MAG TPA: hypothetical protein VGN72_10330 [Tepidisphaeraceae bacterium]|nr:hypothetical protein [Tepidisphaeraceae bacterium]